MEEIFKKLNINADQYFLTGSRGLDTPSLQVSSIDSDYDYVTQIANRQLILDWLIQQNIIVEFSCYNGGFKFTYDNKIYNVITAVNIEFMAWREALEILKLLIVKDSQYHNAIKIKKTRYCLYESLRALIKTSIILGQV